MTLRFEPIHPLFGAEVSGIDLKTPLAPATVAAIDAAMDRYAVLVFRDQPMDQDEQIRFTRQFGPLDVGFKKVAGHNPRMRHHELGDISNVGPDGQVVGREHKRIVSNLANQLWHSDSSFQKPAARYSMLSALVVPSWGGETEFADMRAAYDALPERMKQELEGLEAVHYVLHSRILLGDDQYTDEQRNAIPPVQWPIVRTHAGSGRRHLFIGAHASHVAGMTVAEGRMLLADLLEHATQPRFVHRHGWRPGDLVIWDNRCSLHRGRRYDLSERRELRRSTTLDVPAGEGTAAVA